MVTTVSFVYMTWTRMPFCDLLSLILDYSLYVWRVLSEQRSKPIPYV